MAAILMMSAKLATLGLPKTKASWNKGHDLKSKALSCGTN